MLSKNTAAQKSNSKTHCDLTEVSVLQLALVKEKFIENLPGLPTTGTVIIGFKIHIANSHFNFQVCGPFTNTDALLCSLRVCANMTNLNQSVEYKGKYCLLLYICSYFDI